MDFLLLLAVLICSKLLENFVCTLPTPNKRLVRVKRVLLAWKVGLCGKFLASAVYLSGVLNGHKGWFGAEIWRGCRRLRYSCCWMASVEPFGSLIVVD